MTRPSIIKLLLLGSLLIAQSSASVPADWIEYTPGNCNVVISSPHGGSKLVPEIPNDRTDGCLESDGSCRWVKGCSPSDSNQCRAATVRDSYSQEIAAKVVQHLTDTYGCRPHFIRSNVHRSRLDPNREPAEATQGDALAFEAWQLYHEQYMTSAVAAVKSQFVRGLVIDVHGQGHSEQWTELGYLLSSSSLDAAPSSLARSSIRGLWTRLGATPEAAASLLTGQQSFGALLEKRGQKVVPGPTYTSPKGGNYFNGGYTVARYGSVAGGEIDAIQVEVASGIRFDSARRDSFAADLASAIDEFRRNLGYA